MAELSNTDYKLYKFTIYTQKSDQCIPSIIDNNKIKSPCYLLSMMLAQISAPTPNCGQPPSTVTRWFVFITDLMMASLSNGRMLRRLMTSHSMPCPASSCAASRAKPTGRECATMVTCLPARKEKPYGVDNYWIYCCIKHYKKFRLSSYNIFCFLA